MKSTMLIRAYYLLTGVVKGLIFAMLVGGFVWGLSILIVALVSAF